ncbi:MAG: glycosyl hydrolase family 18 protein [Marinifilaceae bacterium]
MVKRILFQGITLLMMIACSKHDEISLENLSPTNSHFQTKTASQHNPLVVGYFPSWSETYPNTEGSRLRNIPEEVTHIFLSFVKPNMRYQKGSLDIKQVGIEVPYDGEILKETVTILKDKGIKVILSIGGETYWGTDEAYDINHQQIADFVRDFGFDGIDWDYEPNGGFQTIGEPKNVERFIDMIRSSRALLPQSEGFLIACAPAGCGALGRPTPYTQNDDPESPYAYTNRALVTGDDLANEYNSTSSAGYTISLYGFASTGHMIPVFKAVGDMIDFVAFQGYNTGSASKREIMYDSYAYYANKHGFRVAFGMHIPEEPWGPYYTYDESKLREFTEYVAQGGKHNRAGKGDGVMFWQLLQKSAINTALDGIEYSKIAYSILENNSPITTPSVKISTPSNNAIIREGETITFSANVRRANEITFYVDDILVQTLTAEPFTITLPELAIGTHLLKVKATNNTGETATDQINIKIIDKNSVENIPTWKANVVYATAGTEVLHNNKVWSNKWWTQGDEPGIADVWQHVRGGDGGNGDGGNGDGGNGDGGNGDGGNGDGGNGDGGNGDGGNGDGGNGDGGNGDGGNGDGGNGDGGNGDGGNGDGGNGDIPQYDITKSYPTPGTIVIFEGKKYKSKWWVNIGETPGMPNGPWEIILENGEGTTPDKALAYDLTIPYPTPQTHVIYNGHIYKNKWYASAGDYPGKDPWGPWEFVK